MCNDSGKNYNVEEIGFLWYQYGCEHTDPSYVRFLAHWMAFNWIYSKYQGIDERKKINRFIDQYSERLESVTDFDDHIYKPFLKGIVQDMKTKSPFWPRENYHLLIDNFQPKIERIRALFMTMYQVRCNLFHGQKNPDSDRDRKLVEATAIVLEHYLEVVAPEEYKPKDNTRFHNA